MNTKPDQRIGRSIADSTRLTTSWYFILAPIVLGYLAVAFYIVQRLHPASGLLDLHPNTAEAMLLDLFIVAALLVAMIAVYIGRLNKTQKEQRQRFIAAYAGQRLVQARHNRQLVYAVLKTAESGTITQMQLVWTADGPCENGEIYNNVDQNTVVNFDQRLFAKG